MNAMPEQVGMMRLARTAAIHVAAEDFADFGMIAHADEAGTEAVLRTGEDRRLVFPCQTIDFDRISQGSGQWSADVDGLAGTKHRLGLFEVRPAVDAHDHDG